MTKKVISLIVLAVFLSAAFYYFVIRDVGESNTALRSSTTGELIGKYTYPIVDTKQGTCFNDSEVIKCPSEGEAFYGQDAQYTGNEPSYTDNGNGTIKDNVTGLVWTQELSESSMIWSKAASYCEALTEAGVTDWRLPNLKELWSIRDFSQGWPWVDTKYFHLVGDGSEGAQQHSWSSNYYLVDTEESKDNIAFIVNDWTGHIKAMDGERFVRCVSGDEYGDNDFVDNGDGTVTDKATGLIWAQDDNGVAVNWKDALAYAEEAVIAGYDDWRLPNIKELQSLADYSGAYPTMDTNVFNLTSITNEAGNVDYPYYWSGTSNPYIDPRDKDGYWYAWYFAAGYAVGTDGEDIHGAGAVRFDTKSESGADGPDGERYYNYVRLVRGGDVNKTPNGNPGIINEDRIVSFEAGIVSRGGERPDAKTTESAQPTAAAPEDSRPVISGSENTPPTNPSGSSEIIPSNTQPTDGQGGQGVPDFAAAATTLGVTEAELISALGEPGQGVPDFATAAATLGVTEAELTLALGIVEGGTPPEGGQRPEGRP